MVLGLGIKNESVKTAPVIGGLNYEAVGSRKRVGRNWPELLD